MKALLDSSALAKRYIDESGSEAVEEILGETTSLAVSVIAVPEVVSALCRRRRESLMSRQEYAESKSALLEDVDEAFVVNITPNLIARAVNVLEANSLRAMDAIHVASALEWGAGLFVSADHRQLRAAKKSGLKTKEV